MVKSTTTAPRIVITFPQLQLNPFDIPKFRGYLAHKYPHYTLLHNHLKDGRLRYAYPSIQFKTINQQPAIVGIGAGIEILKRVFLDLNELDLDGQLCQLDEKEVTLELVTIGPVETPVTYRFLLPWMGLNQENYRHYQNLNWSERRAFLEKVIGGNLKSLAKGFDYFIPDFSRVNVQTKLTPEFRNFKNRRMLCFLGTFTTNFLVPDYLGLGKQTARGFGTVVRISNGTEQPFSRRTGQRFGYETSRQRRTVKTDLMDMK